jgi:hypothetical protein
MKACAVISFFLLAISAIRIPANQTNGVYKAYYDKDGNEVHVP